MDRTDTILIHGGVDGDPATGSVTVPIYQTSTFRVEEPDKFPEFAYSRVSNPTRSALEKLIAELEHGDAGFAFASGMAAVTAALFLFHAGDKLLVSSNVYGGTVKALEQVFKNFGLTYELIDTSDLELVESRITAEVAGIFVETPGNPLLAITDLQGIAELGKKHNVLTVVDNTFMTPLLQRPLDFGIDVVVHSATKYLGGHSDVIAGLLVTSTPELTAKVNNIKNATGAILGPWDSWIVQRGIKTLSVRLERHQKNALEIVDFLEKHEGVVKIYYPGLPDFPGYEIHKKQANGPGAMVSFVLSDEYDVRVFMKSLKVIALAMSLGGVESLIGYPVTMTHGAVPPEERQRIGIVDNLVRLSVGIEDKDTLIEDLEQAFAKAKIK